MTRHFAPIALFAYNRPDHLRRTIASLAANPEAQWTNVHAFSDGARNAAIAPAVAAVRAVLHEAAASGAFAEVIISERPQNAGLARAIIEGVTQLLATKGRAIVMEDDLVVAPDYLAYMNAALDFYRDRPEIGSVTGYSPLLALPADYRDHVYRLPRNSSLGWATWHDRWAEVDWEVRDFAAFSADRTARAAFDACGADRYDRLRRQMESDAQSWSIRFGYWQSRHGRSTIYPAVSRLKHIGYDGSGTHSGDGAGLNDSVADHAIPFALTLPDVDPRIMRQFRRLYSGALPTRIGVALRNNRLGWIERRLRALRRMSQPARPSALFHYPVLNIGGAEKSLLRLMALLLDHGWSVELVLNSAGGTLEPAIDPRITVRHLGGRQPGGAFLAAHGWRARLAERRDAAGYAWHWLERQLRALGMLRRTYDVAVVSLHGLSPWLVCRRVRARSRLHWVRNDLRSCDRAGKAARGINRYQASIDHYACVSETVRSSLIERFPQVAGKAVTFYNVIDGDAMRAAAGNASDPFPPAGEVLRVLSVCRLADQAKGLFRMLDVHRRLRNEGVRHLWYVLGEGPDRDRLANAIAAAGVSDSFILLGADANPFPYYRHCDVVAALSYYEGLCGAVNEAKIMGRPVIATRFSGIEEQIGDGRGGLIVENDADAIAAGLRRMLTEPLFRAAMTNTILPEAIADDRDKAALFARLAALA